MGFSNLRLLINSKEPINLELAFQLIMASEDKKEYLEELYLVWKLVEDEKIAQQAEEWIIRVGYVGCLDDIDQLVGAGEGRDRSGRWQSYKPYWDRFDEDWYEIRCFPSVIENFPYSQYNFPKLIEEVLLNEQQRKKLGIDLAKWQAFIWTFGNEEQKMIWRKLGAGAHLPNFMPIDLARMEQNRIPLLALQGKGTESKIALELILKSGQVAKHIESLYRISCFARDKEDQKKAIGLIREYGYPNCYEDLEYLLRGDLERVIRNFKLRTYVGAALIPSGRSFDWIIETLLRGAYRDYWKWRDVEFYWPSKIPLGDWNSFVYWFGTDEQNKRWLQKSPKVKLKKSPTFKI